MNHDVFISYSKKDAKRIKPLRDALTVAGIKYWIDDRIDGSENFLAEIPDAIKKCSIVLFVASQNSANSEWTQKELIYARSKGKEIFPYKLDDFQFENCAELDFFFTNIQWKENVDDVVAGLGKKLGINVPTQTPPSVMKRMTGTLIIKTDLDCRVFNYGEEIGVAKAGEYTKLELPLGDNELKYMGLESEEDSYEELIVIDEKLQKYIRVALFDKYCARVAQDKVEQQLYELARIKTENETKAKEERIAYLLSLPSDQFEKFEDDDVYGLKLKSTGETVVVAKYDDIWWDPLVEESLFTVKLKGKMGLIDKAGNEIVPLKYDYVKEYREGLVGVRSNWRYGFVDKTGVEVIPCKYEDVDDFRDGCVGVKLNGKWGFIDRTGKEIVPFKYATVGNFCEGLSWVKLNGRMGFIDKTGCEVVPLKYDHVEPFSEGLAIVSLYGSRGYVDRKVGYVNKAGDEVIPLKYDAAVSYCNGKAKVKIDNEWFCIDKTGREVYDDEYLLSLPDDEFEEIQESGKSGFVLKSTREIVIPIKYDGVMGFCEGLARVELGGKYGFVDKTGREVISAKYNMAGNFNQGLSRVCLNGKWGFIDENGIGITSFKYDAAGYFSEGLAPVNLNCTWGFIDVSGKEIIAFRYDDAEPFCDGLARVRFGYSFGFIDKSGEWVIPNIYEDAYSFIQGKARVLLNGEWFYIDKNGNRVK